MDKIRQCTENLKRAVQECEAYNHEIRKNQIISDYFQNELALCRIMQRINLSLVGILDLDIGDFQDIIKW